MPKYLIINLYVTSQNNLLYGLAVTILFVGLFEFDLKTSLLLNLRLNFRPRHLEGLPSFLCCPSLEILEPLFIILPIFLRQLNVVLLLSVKFDRSVRVLNLWQCCQPSISQGCCLKIEYVSLVRLAGGSIITFINDCL